MSLCVVSLLWPHNLCRICRTPQRCNTVNVKCRFARDYSATIPPLEFIAYSVTANGVVLVLFGVILVLFLVLFGVVGVVLVLFGVVVGVVLVLFGVVLVL